jgi:hypothetical protein
MVLMVLMVPINSNKIENSFCLYFYLYKQHDCTKTMLRANTSAFSAWTRLSPKTLEQQQREWEKDTVNELMAILQIPLYNLHLIPHFH